MATKYYAVKEGRCKGIFMTWAECQKQVTGFPGAVFKSFLTLEEAKQFLEGGQQSSATDFEALLAEEGTLIAYVDGSFNNVTGAFSYGMVLLDGQEEHTSFQAFADPELAAMRNVAGEIKGAEAAMRYAVEHHYSRLYIFHDYEGIAKWCQGIWKTNKEGTKAYKAYYDSICDKLKVHFVKVAAHTGEHYNEMADSLAKEALGLK